MFKCAQSLENRKPLRLILEIVFFFVVPAVLSGCCYFRINRAWLHRVSHTDRASKLTEVFRGSWILWVLTWTPAYVIMIVTSLLNSKIDDDLYMSFGFFLDTVIVYAMQLVTPIQMLYSQINPIFFMLTIEGFQNCVSKWATPVRNATTCTKKKNRVESEQKTNRSTHVCVKKLVVSAVVLIISMCCAIKATLISESRQSSALVSSAQCSTNLSEKIFEQRIKRFSSVADLVRNNDFQNIREQCSVNRGTFNYQLKRCYFIIQHGEPGLNFSSQVSACEIKGAVLSYPRSETEISYLWDLFEQKNDHLSNTYFRNFSLHIGLSKSKKLFGGYLSVDKEMNFSWTDPIWFYRKRRQISLSRIWFPFMSPSICVTKAKILSSCLPRQRKTYSICSHNV